MSQPWGGRDAFGACSAQSACVRVRSLFARYATHSGVCGGVGQGEEDVKRPRGASFLCWCLRPTGASSHHPWLAANGCKSRCLVGVFFELPLVPNGREFLPPVLLVKAPGVAGIGAREAPLLRSLCLTGANSHHPRLPIDPPQRWRESVQGRHFSALTLVPNGQPFPPPVLPVKAPRGGRNWRSGGRFSAAALVFSRRQLSPLPGANRGAPGGQQLAHERHLSVLTLAPDGPQFPAPVAANRGTRRWPELAPGRGLSAANLAPNGRLLPPPPAANRCAQELAGIGEREAPFRVDFRAQRAPIPTSRRCHSRPPGATGIGAWEEPQTQVWGPLCWP